MSNAVIEKIENIIKMRLDAAESRGRKEGRNDANERVAADMLRDGKPINEITRYSRLAEDTIRSLAKSLGVAVV